MTPTSKVKETLKRHLEEGTYLVQADEVLPQVREILRQATATKGDSHLPQEERDPELLEIALELFAGLTICQAVEGLLSQLRLHLEDSRLLESSKMKVTGVARSFLFDPERARESLAVFDVLIHSPFARLADYSTRVFLQVLSEMRVGGFATVLLQDESRLKRIRSLLEELSAKGWLEAGELFDLLLA